MSEDIEIEIEIDGKPLKAKPNSMIIQVADEAGIYIPRFCYHKHLSIAANCRMCLVEVEKAPKPAPACATPIMPGMKVFTRSAKALAAQRAVMEFLLINHPLDCPICDQGGECELQDLSMGYGTADSFYTFGKRSVKDEDLGPLISSDMTRCIQCTRCVRFGDEIAGLRELGAIGRGEEMEIGTYVQKAIQSEVSGNVIDICPVGALTSKPFRFTARAWELNQFPSIAAHDCLGSHIHIHVHNRHRKVMRVVPRENDAINQTWISDRDRFSYPGLYHENRLAKPRIRIDNAWRETDWQTALEFAAHKIQETIHKHGADQAGALASPNSTTEEFYLLQKIMRDLGSQHIDHRLRQADFSDEAPTPAAEIKLSEIETCDVIVLIGSHPQKEQPILGLRVRKAALKGAKVIAVNMMDHRYHFDVAFKQIVAPHQFTAAIANMMDSSHPAAEILRTGKKIAILVGASALNHPEANTIKKYIDSLANQYQGKRIFLTEGANSAGAWIAGAIPTPQTGLHATAMLENPRKMYVLLNVDPELDCANPLAAKAALAQAECVISLSLFNNPVLERFAHVMLPIAAFAETSGTFVNVEGTWQSFQGVTQPFEEARPAWKVLRVLANFLHLDAFQYENSEAILAEMKNNGVFSCDKKITDVEIQLPPENRNKNNLSRIGEIPSYRGDSIVRHAKALQAAQTIIEGDLAVARMHPKTAEKYQIKENQVVEIKQRHSIRIPVVFDIRVPEQAVYLAAGIEATSELSELFGEVQIIT